MIVGDVWSLPLPLLPSDVSAPFIMAGERRSRPPATPWAFWSSLRQSRMKLSQTKVTYRS